MLDLVPKAVARKTRDDDGRCLRRRAEVENVCLYISGSHRARFPAVAVLSARSKRSVFRFVYNVSKFV